MKTQKKKSGEPIMPLRWLAVAAVVLLMASARAPAQDPAPADSLVADESASVHHRNAQPGPVLSLNDGWARKVVEVILLGFFVPAAIIGPWVRKRIAAELPELHVQEEQSGLTASQHEPGHGRP